MSIVTIGRIQPIHRGAYDAATAYSTLDIVSYQGGSYQCVSDTAITGTPPVNGSGTLNAGWHLVASKGDKGGKGDKGDAGDPGTFTGTFSLNANGELELDDGL